jgi:hypothetical protein
MRHPLRSARARLHFRFCFCLHALHPVLLPCGLCTSLLPCTPYRRCALCFHTAFCLVACLLGARALMQCGRCWFRALPLSLRGWGCRVQPIVASHAAGCSVHTTHHTLCTLHPAPCTLHTRRARTLHPAPIDNLHKLCYNGGSQHRMPARSRHIAETGRAVCRQHAAHPQ